MIPNRWQPHRGRALPRWDCSLEVPDELYLRELGKLDLGDSRDIVEFVNQFGRLGHPRQPVTRKTTGQPLVSPNPQIIGHLGITAPKLEDLPWDEWYAEIDKSNIGKELGVFEQLLVEQDGLQHLDSFRAWALAFRRMTAITAEYQAGEASATDLENLALVLTVLLAPFSPTLTLLSEYDEQDRFNPFGDSFPRLENVLALQMYRHIVSGDVYLVCANETCGRPFVRQRGRAASGQYRTEGVIYCRDNCAKAQVQRQYRSRKAEELRAKKEA